MMDEHSNSSSVCDVCSKEGPVKVHGSGLGPASFAYCEECIMRNAESFLMIATAIFVAGGPDQIDTNELGQFSTYLDGQYTDYLAVLKIYDELEDGIRSEFFG